MLNFLFCCFQDQFCPNFFYLYLFLFFFFFFIVLTHFPFLIKINFYFYFPKNFLFKRKKKISSLYNMFISILFLNFRFSSPQYLSSLKSRECLLFYLCMTGLPFP